MDMKLGALSLCAVLLTLVTDTFAKSVSHSGLISEKDIQTWSCTCDILDSDAKVLHSYNDMGLPNDLAWQGFSIHDQCKAIRHFCRDQCGKRVEMHEATDGKPLGYQLCALHGQPTPQDGGVPIYAQASLYTGGEHCHPTQSLKAVSLKANLCCGHTSITVKDKTILAFGWNPDCKAQMFIID